MEVLLLKTGVMKMSANMDISGNKTIGGMTIGVFNSVRFSWEGFTIKPSVLMLPCAYYSYLDRTVFCGTNSLYKEWIEKGYYYHPTLKRNIDRVVLLDLSNSLELTCYLDFGSRVTNINEPTYNDVAYLRFQIHTKNTNNYANAGTQEVNRGYNMSGLVPPAPFNDETDNVNYLYFTLDIYSIPNSFACMCGFSASSSGYFRGLQIQDFGTKWKQTTADVWTYGNATDMSLLFSPHSYNINLNDLLSVPQPSTPQGGSGTYDTTSDPVPIPSLPTLGAANGGFITIYKPTSAQAQSFFSWLWSTDFESMFNKLWYNPLDLIVGCYVSRISPTNIGGMSEIKLAGHGTNINSDFVSNQYEFIDCGTLNISEFYGNFLDYQSEVKIYLPYIGERSIDINEFMAGSIQVKYALDFATGICVAFIYIVKGNLQAVLYQFSGNFLSQIPISSVDNRSIISSGISLALSGASVLAKPSASSVFGVVNSATNFLESKASVQHTGGLSGNSGYMAIQYPYLIFNRPIQSMSEGFKQDRGYTSNIYAEHLSELSGYTEVSYMDLSTIPCSESERDNILSLLKEGVYL